MYEPGDYHGSRTRTPEYPFSGQIPIRAKPGRFLRNVTSNPGQNRRFGGGCWAPNPGNFGPRRQPGSEIRENGRKMEYFGSKTTSPGVFGRKCCLKSGPNCLRGVRAKLVPRRSNLERDIRGSYRSARQHWVPTRCLVPVHRANTLPNLPGTFLFHPGLFSTLRRTRRYMTHVPVQ
jgi:hypothetical protein